MKKILFAFPVALGICCMSCNDKAAGGMSDAAKKNLDAMHGIQKAFETKDFSKVGDYIAADGLDHTTNAGDLKGLDNIKANFVKMASMSEGDKSTIVKELADDEYVMSWSKYSGKATAAAAAMGMKPGDQVDMEAIEVCKFKDGKAIEHWSMMQLNEAKKMLPPPPMPDMKMQQPDPNAMKKDSMSKPK